MLAGAVQDYLSVRHAAGFALKQVGIHLKSFAAYSDAKHKHYLNTQTAIDWASQSPSSKQRVRRLADVIRLAHYLHAEDARHEIPPKVFGSERRSRPTPYILSEEQIRKIILLASHSGYPTLRRQTYSTLFALLACTGLRVSEAIRLMYDDITPDGLIIRATKFNKTRLVPIHDTARAGLNRYLQQRRPYAPFDKHVFISLRRKPLTGTQVDVAFGTVAERMNLPRGRGRHRPTPHSFRHSFAVRSLNNCSDSRDHITQHMLMLSTYLGHCNVSQTYWYLEAVPDLMKSIADRCETFLTGQVP